MVTFGGPPNKVSTNMSPKVPRTSNKCPENVPGTFLGHFLTCLGSARTLLVGASVGPAWVPGCFFAVSAEIVRNRITVIIIVTANGKR